MSLAIGARTGSPPRGGQAHRNAVERGLGCQHIGAGGHLVARLGAGGRCRFGRAVAGRRRAERRRGPGRWPRAGTATGRGSVAGGPDGHRSAGRGLRPCLGRKPPVDADDPWAACASHRRPGSPAGACPLARGGIAGDDPRRASRLHRRRRGTRGLRCSGAPVRCARSGSCRSSVGSSGRWRATARHLWIGLFTGAGSQLVAVDVSDPGQPRLVGQRATPGTILAIAGAPSGHLVALLGGGLGSDVLSVLRRARSPPDAGGRSARPRAAAGRVGAASAHRRPRRGGGSRSSSCRRAKGCCGST